MITIVAKHTVRPENIERFKALALQMVGPTRKEPGCHLYVLHQGVKDPCVLTFVEDWEDQASLDAHGKTSHFTTIVPHFAALLAREPEIDVYHLVE